MSNSNQSQTERRVIFLIIFLGVMLPMIFPLGLKTEVSPQAKMVYDLIESTPKGAKVIVSFDYDPSSAPELHPMAKAIIEHAWRKGHCVAVMALWPQGVQLAGNVFTKLKEKYPNKKYGIDYVNLGYKPSGMVTIQAMGRNIYDVFPQDMLKNDLHQVPMFHNIKTIKDFSYIVGLSAGDPGLKQWIMAAHDMYGVKVTGGTTAVSTPGFVPYINNQNQLYGLLGGLKAAAEYEMMVGIKGPATVKMDAQAVAHVLILSFIAIGNFKSWRSKNKKRIIINNTEG